MKIKMLLHAELPEALAQPFLQHLRNFDTAHPGCHFEMLAVTDMDNAEVERVLDSIDPPFKSRVRMPIQ